MEKATRILLYAHDDIVWQERTISVAKSYTSPSKEVENEARNQNVRFISSLLSPKLPFALFCMAGI